MLFREQDIDAITSAIIRLEAALERRTDADESWLPAIESMIERLKTRRARIIVQLKPRMH